MSAASGIDAVAKQFVVCSLALSHVDNDALDMEFLPNRSWPDGVATVMQGAAAVQDREVKLELLADMVTSLRTAATALKDSDDRDDSVPRARWIEAEARALRYRIGMIRGEHKVCAGEYDRQCEELYNILPSNSVQDFPADALPSKLQDELAGIIGLLEEKLACGVPVGTSTLTLAERFDLVRAKFVVPKAYYKDLFLFALEECRRRCRDKNMACPDLPRMKWEDSMEITWEAFEGFKGNGQSEMQVNIARLLSLDKFMQLPAHEAYPGHHTMFRLVEERSVKRDGFVELGIVNTFSPYSFVAEGGAEWGAQALLWGDLSERVAFGMRLLKKLWELMSLAQQSESGSEKAVESPDAPRQSGICGLLGAMDKFDEENPALHDLVTLWVRAAAITDPLGKAIGAVHCGIARKLLDRTVSLDEAKKLMFEQGFRGDDSWPNAGFLHELGAYIVNYSFAKTIVGRWIQHLVQSGGARDEWDAFEQWAARPVLPADMLRRS